MKNVTKFNPMARYVLARSRPLGSCRRPGDIVSIEEIGERRARQAAEQFLILPTHVEVVGGLTLSAKQRYKPGTVISASELGASILKRYLGLRLQPAPAPANAQPVVETSRVLPRARSAVR